MNNSKIVGWVSSVMVFFTILLAPFVARAQAPGTTPVDVSYETQMMHGRRYYVHIVKTGQTVYSIAKAYKVQSYDAVTHVDIHFLHEGDTVWLPMRGQFGDAAESSKPQVAAPQQQERPATKAVETPKHQQTAAAPKARSIGKTIKVAVMMPLHLDQMDQISTSKFDIEQRGKKSYREFEFIEFYEGLLLALDNLAEQGVSVELNVVDVSDNQPEKVEEAFRSHNVGQSDFVIALLLRDCFDRAAELAREAGIYIVNPMATRSELCAENPYMVKIQPSLAGLVSIMLSNMKTERPEAHLYIVHSASKNEKPILDELRRQLDERGDIRYTIFNWSQNAKLTNTLKGSPSCNVLSIYDQSKDQNRVYAGNLLNRLAAFKSNTPTLYTVSDWTRDYYDIDFNQLQQLNYHTFCSSWDMTNDIHVEFLKAFRTRYGTEPTSQLASTAYDLTLYIVGGLSAKGADFWQTPGLTRQSLTQPMLLQRNGAGLENNRAQLYRMEGLRFIKAAVK